MLEISDEIAQFCRPVVTQDLADELRRGVSTTKRLNVMDYAMLERDRRCLTF